MTTALNPFATHLDVIKRLIDFCTEAQEGIDPTLAELIKIRASQINGCAACLYFHTREARARGLSDDQLFMLSGWKESPLFDERERAALEWTETLTRLADHWTSQQAYEDLQRHFNEEDVTRITLLIAGINAFNRVNVGSHVQHPVDLTAEAA
jgi:AhpD family alkylhydroperoxidase